MKKLKLVIAFFFCLQFLMAQNLQELESYIEKARIDFGITGMSVGIVKDGKVVMQKGFGLRHSEKTEKVDEHTLFAIASISKAFTVTALSMLEQEGKLEWSDPVKSHLPYFQLHDSYVTSLITIEDITCHRSGLATFDGDLLWYGTDYSREEIVRRISKLPLKKTFRLDFGYQNIMYITSGEVIRNVSGKTWDDFLTERIFQPMGMLETKASIRQFNSATNYAAPHLKGNPIDLLNYDNSGATAALNSNVSDMCKWISMWLNKGVYDGDTLIQPDNFERIWSPHTNLAVGNFDKRNGSHFKSYGMGWFLLDYQGYKIAHHGGGLPGYISKIAVVPEMDLGMIILTNDNTSLPTALMYQIIDFYHNNTLEERDWAAEFLTYNKGSEAREELKVQEENDSRVPDTKPSHLPEDYAGIYEDAMYGRALVSLKDGALEVVLEPTKKMFHSKMIHWHYDTFEIAFNDPFLPRGFLTFYFDERAAVSGFKIHLPNGDFNFYNLDFKRKN